MTNKDKNNEYNGRYLNLVLIPTDTVLDQFVSRHIARLPKDLVRRSNIWIRGGHDLINGGKTTTPMEGGYSNG